jgi:hypothetical protein
LIEVFVGFAPAIIALGGVILGYWMGRNSAGRHLSDKPKELRPPKKKKEGVRVKDPYSEALKPNMKGRIPTMEEE